MIITNMFWDKKESKKESNLPELPQLKGGFDELSLPMPHEQLPSFPDSSFEKGFSQTAIKDAVTNDEIKEADSEEGISGPTTSRISELREWQPSEEEKTSAMNQIRQAPEAEAQEMQEEPESAIRREVIMPKKEKHDVYIKLDKFYTAKKSLDAVSVKLAEVTRVLEKIRETKMREEQELSSWEKELASIKARIQNVAENIFER